MQSDQPRPAGGDGRWTRWVFAVTGVALLIVSVVMMTIGARP
jgi:hypothetical protein